MRNFRKVLVGLLLMILVLNTVALASPVEVELPGGYPNTGKISEKDVSIVSENGKFILNVEVNLEKFMVGQNIIAVLYFNDSNKAVYADQVTITSDIIDKGVYKFNSYTFKDIDDSGEYTIKVSGNGITQGYDEVVYFYGPDAKKTSVCSVVAADNSSDFITKLKEDTDSNGVTTAEKIGISDIERIDSLSTDSKDKLFKLVDNEDNYFNAIKNESDVDTIMKLAAEYVTLFETALTIAQYYDLENSTEFEAWFESNKVNYGITGKDSSGVLIDTPAGRKSAKIYSAFESLEAADKSDGGNRIATLYADVLVSKVDFPLSTPAVALTNAEYSPSLMSEEPTWDDVSNNIVLSIADDIQKEIILKVVQFENSSKIEDLIANTDVLGMFSTDIQNKLGALSSDEEETFFGTIKGSDNVDFLALQTLCNTKLDEIINKRTSGSTDNKYHGGGGGSYGGGGGTISVTPIVQTPDAKASKYFDDLTGFDWAVDSINALFEKSVINGKSNRVFDPGANVTRAEFVKMMIEALGFSTDNIECDFTDVSSDMWQYKYIAAAHKFGIVNGYADGRFGINDAISRQDMAVITERALKVYGFEFAQGNLNFADSEQISDYAQSAISNLASANIITGMPDGNFNPRSFVTRAQAACVIYRAVSK